MNFQQRAIENYLMPSAGIGENSLMPMPCTSYARTRHQVVLDLSLLKVHISILAHVPSVGKGEDSLMPMQMPSAGIGENSLMPSACMNSQEKEFSGNLAFQPSTSFGNPDPRMVCHA
ncbi:hypothetical protein GOBAR_DD09879 [Gossypium barbadense]|nr:hypothetical protein GOBAR_DD09879 [Gossypium barbadense]